MDMSVREQGDGVVIALSGWLSSSECEEIRKTVHRSVASQTKTLRIDLRAVTFIDSIAMGALVGIKKVLTEDGIEMVLVAPSPQVLETLRRAKLDRVFSIVGTADGEGGKTASH
jgi:anti-anti-sigma factor